MSKLIKKVGTAKKKLVKKPKIKAPEQLTTRTPEIDEKPKYASLVDVMDKTRDISFFYSGVEYSNYLQGCYDMGIRNFLMSYHYLSGRGLKDIFETYPDIHLFVDSGAFTYTTDAKYADRSVEEWEQHIQKYLRWADRNKEHIFAIANLDIEGLVGAEQVKKWNREYFEPFMLQTGVPVCFVYHNGLTDGTWDNYCQRYPYVGFSSINTNGEQLSMNDYREYLRTAEKHNTMVHGFGMTKIKELAELPYYTVDSTTWKVGMMYGKLIIFDGKTVKQIGKDDWENKALPIIENYPINIDVDLLWDYYEPEVIRANVYAFMLAEEYVKNSIKHLQYWQKSQSVKNDFSTFKFPTVDWLKLDPKPTSEIIEWAKKLNINPDRDINDVALTVVDMVSFCCFVNPEYKEVQSWYTGDNVGVLDELHDKYINRIVPDEDSKINDLMQFYQSCFRGENDTLLNEGTNFDRMVKERKEYLDDTEYVNIELSREEALSKVGILALPENTEDAPELDELEEEVFTKVGIKPNFDEKGRFIGGNTIVRNPQKSIYSKAFPKFACDTCNAAAKCPEYKAGYVCAYSKIFQNFDTRNADDVIQAMQSMANHNITRMQKAMVMEMVNGTIDTDVTNLINQNMGILQTIFKFQNSKDPLLTQKRVTSVDGTVAETTVLHNPTGGGIMEQLMQSVMKPKTVKEDDIIEADFDEVDDNDDVVVTEE